MRFISVGLCLTVMVFVTACGDTKPPAETAVPNATQIELERLQTASINDQPPYAGLDDTPIATACFAAGEEGAICDVNRLQMLQAWPLAWSGDYQAQRNVAFMLSQPTVGIPQNIIQGCAWRKVILASGHPDISPIDTDQEAIECGKLSPKELETAGEVSKTILAKIKN